MGCEYICGVSFIQMVKQRVKPSAGCGGNKTHVKMLTIGRIIFCGLMVKSGENPVR